MQLVISLFIALFWFSMASDVIINVNTNQNDQNDTPAQLSVNARHSDETNIQDDMNRGVLYSEMINLMRARHIPFMHVIIYHIGLIVD